SLLKSDKFDEVVALIETLSFSSLESELVSSENELDAAMEKMKQNALSSYNVAVSKRNSSAPNADADSLLLSSKKALEEKNYLKSLVGSSRASGLVVAAPLNNFEIPLPIYPLLLVVIGVAFYVYRKSKEEKEPKPFKKLKKA
ncbi:MAG: hypothetical protein KAS30_02060, partial [Candidatus Diapherotrites archaeon]|nr:hypothetical protein [Candidatus Diapherotrites archaeon]